MANCDRLQTQPPPAWRRRQQQQQQRVLSGEGAVRVSRCCWLWIAAAFMAAAAASPPLDSAPNGGEACPAGCACSSDRSRVACNGVGMKAIPKLPYVTEHLDLSGSSVPVTNGTFSSGCCAGLTTLNLSHIGVRHLPEGGLLGLSSLQSLRLADCKLTDTSLPVDTFRPVRQLRELDLSSNPQLFAAAGSSTTAIIALRLLAELRSLNLSATGLSSIGASLAPTLLFLDRLETLSLSDNPLLAIEMTRDLANQLNRNDVLQVLELANCGLRRIDPEAMTILKTVTNLDLSGNRISASDLKRALDGTPSDAALQRLSLARLGLRSLETGGEGGSLVSILAGLRSAVKLSVLDLSGNQLASLGRRQFAMLQQLKRLDLSDNRIESLDQLNFDGLGTLTHLVLSRNRIASIGDFDFENNLQLQHLDLSGNRVANVSRGFLTGVFGIQSLDLSDNALSSVGQIGALELISELKLAGNQLSSPGALPSYTNLLQLDLSRNRIQSLTSASAWVATSSLTLLNLSGNAIADVEPAVFARHSPQVLDLSANRLERIRDLGCRVSTQRLLLRGNRARAVDAGAFRSLPDLTELDLGDNALVELESTVLSPLGRLSSLRLDGNRLGTYLRGRAGQSLFIVPSSTTTAAVMRASTNGDGGISGTLSPLEELDLSRNGIDALHDGFFRNLTRLRQLSLAGNRLSRFSDGLAVGLDTSLGVLDLSANEFTHAPTSALRAMTSLVEVDLSHNPFDCAGCEGSSTGNKESQLRRATPYGSAPTTRQTPSTPALLRFFDDRAYVCRAPAERQGSNLHDLVVSAPFLLDSCAPETSPLDAASSIDNSEEKKIILIVIGCTAFVILVVAGIIFWHHRWRLKKKQQKQHCKAAYKQAADRAAGCTAAASLTPLHHSQLQQQPLLPQHQSQQPLPCEQFLPPVPSTLPPSSVGRPHTHASLEYGGSCGTYHHRGGGNGSGLPAYV